MKRLSFPVLLLVIVSAIAPRFTKAQTSPPGKNSLVFEVPMVSSNITIMTDGQIGRKEWEGAKKIVFPQNDSCYLLVKQSDEYIFLAIAAPYNMLSYVDLYFDFGENSILNLHSSSQIGERNLTDTSWNDLNPPGHWGNSKDWYANEMRFDRILAQQLLKEDSNYNRDQLQLRTTYRYDGFEYLFRKSRFNKANWKTRVLIRTTMPGYSNMAFPQYTDPKRSDNWATLIF